MAKKPSKPKSKALLDRADPVAPVQQRQHPAPIPFSKIRGQDRALKILADAIASSRVHHAWIFHGPAGVGKFTAALAFAALLLDDSTKAKAGDLPTVNADSKVQHLLAIGSHPDLHIITKELARFSDDAQVRERKLITIPRDVIDTHLIAPAQLASALPGGAASKVFIVDEAELLDRSPTNAPTQNAILKTLEEPPPGTVIILVTTSPDRLLATIRSRSQQVSFGPLNDAELREWVDSHKDEITEFSGRPVGPEDLRFLQSFAAGSPGELLRAHAGNLASWSETLEPLLAQCDIGKYSPGFGPTMAKLIDEWAEAQIGKDKQASKDAANRAGAELMFRLLSTRARQKLRQNPASADRALANIAIIREAERELDAGVQAQFVMEWLSSQLSLKPDAMLV